MHNKSWVKSFLTALFTISMLLGFVPHAWSTVTVTLTAPANGSIVQGSTTVSANASAGQGYAVSKVEFFDGATLIGTDITAPYSVSWSNATSGSHTLTAKATAVKKNSPDQTATSSPITVTFNRLPVASLTSPTDGATFAASANITLNATASDSDGTIAKVDFYASNANDGQQLIGTVTQPPYTFVTSLQPVVQVESGFLIGWGVWAIATDNRGGTGSTATISIMVGPSVTINSPANGATFAAPATITLSATVSNISGIPPMNVSFYNGTTPIGNGSPFSWQNVGPGTYSLTAKAFESGGTVWTSAPVTVTVTAASASALYYIHPDHLNTPRLITNQAQQAVWRWDHAEPFGTYPANENPSGLGAFEFNVRFLGQYFDKETNTHYNYFRDYDPAIGRYVESDPIGLRGGVNTYSYVNQNPLSFIDPNGLEVRLICRPVDNILVGFFYDHCFVYVTCPQEGWSLVLSLFGNPPFIDSTGYKHLAVPGNPANKDDPFSRKNTYNSAITPNCNQDCAYERSVVNRFIAAPPLPYMGPQFNSNNFARHLITDPGFGAGLPSNAPRRAPGLQP